MIENPKVSVIIPVYNTEKYLREALDSISNQTLKEIEIITINDGSTDSSLDILNEYAKKDNRIIVYSQENQGQAIARNFGIEKSKGEYIYFFDSDDILLHEALEETYNKCEKDNLDLCFFDADIFFDDIEYNLYFDYKRCHLLEDKIYNGLEITNKLLDINKFRASPCLYLLNADFLKRIKLYFHNVIYEDELFGSLLYIQAKRVGFICKSFFLRRVRFNSTITKPYSSYNLSSHFFIINQLIEFSNGNKYYKKIIDRFCKNIVNVAVYRASSLGFNERLSCVFVSLIRYHAYIKIKSIIVCLFPFIIKKN
ncbi:MAG: glycosyltransferase family 2 protein [Bacteroidaceae bacterium]|nr:glycosyltransferase family 2 protein [Bacteroidaceae bacterium]MEA5099653.1 glycosyltransferase family 2 protein [Bacteroidales bacterium]